MATREQVSGLLYAFERDIRDILTRFVLSELSDDDALGELAGEARRRQAEEGEEAEESLVEYLDLRPSYDLLNRHRQMLPERLSAETRQLTSELDVLVPIRKRVAHTRPLKSDDLEKVVSSLRCFSLPNWTSLRKALAELASDSEWIPDAVLPRPKPDWVENNLPVPDYDETGLLGRDDLVHEVVDMLKRGRESVVTLAGEGGIGKTAIALEVAYAFLDDPSEPFDIVLWVSLKTEQLTGSGVIELRNTAKNLLGATELLGQAVKNDFSGGIEDLGTLLDGFSVLICVDNLETVSGDEFVQLYYALPESVKYLVTSRQGIGQLERRIPVGPLDEKNALRLLSKLIATRRIDQLKSIEYETRLEIVNGLRLSPLAIRWFILSTESGHEPLTLMHNQDQLVNYCVQSVYDGLDDHSRMILTSVFLLARAVSSADLVVLTGMPVENVKRGLHQLVKGSLVKYTNSDINDLTTLVEVTETARLFLGRAIPEDNPLRELIAKNEATFRRENETRTKHLETRSLAPSNVWTRDPNDTAVALLLRRALLTSNRGDLETSRVLVAEARRLSPEFCEVARVEAFIEASLGNTAVAGARYREAFELAEDPTLQAVVAHFYSGHLARNENDLEGALRFAQIAHRELDHPDSALGLGNALVRLNDYDEGLGLLSEAARESVGKTKLIATTAVTDGYRRRAEYRLAEERNPTAGFYDAVFAMGEATSQLRFGVVDPKLVAAEVNAASVALKALAEISRTHSAVPPLEELCELLDQSLERMLKSKKNWLLVNACHQLPGTGQLPADLLLFVSRILEFSGTTSSPRLDATVESSAVGESPEGSLWGSVLTIVRDRGFGFIKHPDYPQNIFFHASQTPAFEEILEGESVEFTLEIAPDGRPRATTVSLRRDR